MTPVDRTSHQPPLEYIIVRAISAHDEYRQRHAIMTIGRCPSGRKHRTGWPPAAAACWSSTSAHGVDANGSKWPPPSTAQPGGFSGGTGRSHTPSGGDAQSVGDGQPTPQTSLAMVKRATRSSMAAPHRPSASCSHRLPCPNSSIAQGGSSLDWLRPTSSAHRQFDRRPLLRARPRPSTASACVKTLELGLGSNAVRRTHLRQCFHGLMIYRSLRSKLVSCSASNSSSLPAT